MCVNAMPVSAPASPAPSVKIGFAAEGRQLQVVARGAECRALRTKIGRLIDHHEDLHTLSNVSLAALLGFVGVLATRTLRSRASQPSFCLYLLVPPANFSVCVDRSDLRRGILQLAHYIDKLATNANHAFRTLGPNDPTRRHRRLGPGTLESKGVQQKGRRPEARSDVSGEATLVGIGRPGILLQRCTRCT
jgi:hypothetical protein